MVLLEGLGEESKQATVYARSIANKIIAGLSKEYLFGGVRHQSSTSIGIKLFVGDEEKPEQILNEADTAM